MKNIERKIIILMGVILISGLSCFASLPPDPPAQNPNQIIDGLNRPASSQTGPIGTATLLLTALGVGTIGYKVKKNKHDNNR